jgi:hypothetical protein
MFVGMVVVVSLAFSTDVIVLVMVLVDPLGLAGIDREFGRRHAGAKHAVGGDARADREAAERRTQVVERQPGVDERAERHVAGDPREAVEIQDRRH